MTDSLEHAPGLAVLYAQEFTSLGGFHEHFNTEPPWGRSEILQGHAQYFGNTKHPSRPFRHRPGRLMIEARRTRKDRLLQSLLQPYTSGCLNTMHKFHIRNGTLSVRAGMSAGRGLRSLIRLLPVDWELDHRQVDQVVVADSTADGTWCGVRYLSGDETYHRQGKNIHTLPSGVLNTFEVDIQDKGFTWRINGKDVFEVPMPHELYDMDWHLDISLMVGNELSSWGAVSEQTVFPARLHVDHIRHFVLEPPRDSFNMPTTEPLPPTLHQRVALAEDDHQDSLTRPGAHSMTNARANTSPKDQPGDRLDDTLDDTFSDPFDDTSGETPDDAHDDTFSDPFDDTSGFPHEAETLSNENAR